MSWEKSNTVNFAVDGDTTAEAIEKHIEEFTSVYAYLNRLRSFDAGSVAPTDPETGALWLDDAGAISALKQYSGTAWVELNIGQNPIGAVIMYTGAVADIPAGWQLCDGTNGTANMVDKMPLGTITELDFQGTGGSNDAVAIAHTHSIAQHSHTIAHTHSIAHTHTASSNSTGAHTHSIPLVGTEDTTSESGFTTGWTTNGENQTYTGYTSSNGAHSHTITVNSGGGTSGASSATNSSTAGATVTGSAGTAGTNLNLPAYVKFAFIQRMS